MRSSGVKHQWVRLLAGTALGCLALVAGLSAQPDILRFRRFSNQEGLPNNFFRMAIQAADGLIWLASADGLSSFDGYAVREFRHDLQDTTSICGNNVQVIYEDPAGRLWVGTIGGGLCVSDPRKQAFQTIRFPGEHGRPLDLMTIRSVCADSAHRVWVAADNGAWILREADRGWTVSRLEDVLPLPNGGSLPPVNMFYTDARNRVLAGTDVGLYAYAVSEGQWQLPDAFAGLQALAVQDFTTDRKGRLWVSCTGPGPRMFFTQTGLSFTPFSGIPFDGDSRVIRMAVDLDNKLWVGCFGEQAYAYDLDRDSLVFESGRNSDIPFERFFRKPLVDNSGDVWLPCEGFYILPYPKGFKTYRHPFAFHQSNTAIAVIDGEDWLAYREEGIVRLDPANGHVGRMASTLAGPAQIPVDHVQRIFQTRRGEILLIGFGNIAVLDRSGKLLRSFPLGGSNRAAYEDPSGRIWIGGIRGLHRFDPLRGVLDTISLPPILGDSRNFIQAIESDDRGRIWFGSDIKGLACLDPETGDVKQYLPSREDPSGLPSLSILDIAKDRQGRLWLATDIALVRLDPESGEMIAYGRKQGLVNDYITAVLCTPDGHVWVSTNDGIARFDPAVERFTPFTQGDGLVNPGYYPRSKCLGPDGTIYFGGLLGVDFFHPDRLRDNPARPRMYLAGLRVNNEVRVWNPSEILRLRHSEQLIEFTFAGMFHTDQAGVRYRTRVEGLQTDWTDLGAQRQIVLAGLPPGTYTFRARAVTRGGVWSEEELAIPFVIRPPFYATLGFQLGLILLVGATILLGIRQRERAIRRRDRREAEINRKMSELEKRALQSQMNPHFIYNAMNSIQQFMIEQDIEGAMRYLTKFSRILRNVLNLSAHSRVPLTDEIDMIRDYLELERMRFPDAFAYRIEVDPAIPIHSLDIPPFLIQPQVENAIRHGLLRKDKPGHLAIRIRPQGPDLLISVEDDGIGRAAAQQRKMHDPGASESRGLAILQERLAHLHHGQAAGAFTITDLFTADGRPAGTRVDIKIPLD